MKWTDRGLAGSLKKPFHSSGGDDPSMEIELREADLDDMKEIYDWRNHPDVRKNSFSSEPIPWYEHERWFRAKMTDPGTTIYIALFCGEKAGSLRFESFSEGVRVSVMLNPVFTGRGLGPEIIRQGTEKYLREKSPEKPVIAEIRTDNVRSRKAFQKGGFEESHVTYVFTKGKGKWN